MKHKVHYALSVYPDHAIAKCEKVLFRYEGKITNLLQFVTCSACLESINKSS